ncbi:hypothetical protein HDU93_006596 [Gonapodya sp. JEL0774]|nr:hypothetical protein HDU93_006596 [Gonapodya sp. JEL0774]
MEACVDGSNAVDPVFVNNLLDGVVTVLNVVSNLTNIPVFGTCAEALRAVYTLSKDFKDNKELVVRLASRCALLVQAIASRMDPGNKDIREPLQTHAKKFTEFLMEVAKFLETVKGKPKWYRVLNSSATRKELEEYDNRLQSMVNDFQLTATLNLDSWAAENKADRQAEEVTAQNALDQLLKNDATILATLEVTNSQGQHVLEILRGIQATLNVGSPSPNERDLLGKARTSISRISGQYLADEEWHIPEQDVARNSTPFAAGGFGKVYLGTWGGTRRVAIKYLLVEHPPENLKALVHNEVERWYRLRHPNIIQLFGANLRATPPFMVSPYMRNGDLLTYLTKNPRADRIDLIFDIANAMQHLHTKGVLHCDLKALNVLVDDMGHALVADFGFAVIASQVSTLSKEARRGTTNWMAPELFGRKPKLSAKVDVHAFAMTLYEMYTLQIPFFTAMEGSIVHCILSGDRPDIDTYEDLENLSETQRMAAVPMPEPVKKLVKRCWDPLPEQRPTFAEIVKDLKNHFPQLTDPEPPPRLQVAPAHVDSVLAPSATTSQQPSPVPARHFEQGVATANTWNPGPHRHMVAPAHTEAEVPPGTAPNIAARAQPLRPDQYTVGWICALSIELAAATALLDEKHPALDRIAGDGNIYSFGRIGVHNVILARLPAGMTGGSSAATVAAQLMRTFTSVEFGLMVGIGSGVPSEDADIRLGDVVVSMPFGTHGGVVQFDSGQLTSSGFHRTGHLDSPPRMLLNAVTHLRASQLVGENSLADHIAKLTRLRAFSRAATGKDILFDATCNHAPGPTQRPCQQVLRSPRQDEEPVVHYGTIASGSRVMGDAAQRDATSKELGGILCFETEAAGLMSNFPCLVIRGICDYADSHKNQKWQGYAAATAAACAKEMLSVIQPSARRSG